MKTRIPVSGYFEKTGTWKKKGWFYSLSDKGDSIILSCAFFKTKKLAQIWAEELQEKVVPFLKSRAERTDKKYQHGGHDIIGDFTINYPSPYPLPMSSGIGSITKNN